MIKNKAIEVIRTFSKKEMKEFELFIESPFYNSNKTLPLLIRHIRKYLAKPGKNDITEEFLYQKLFPGKKYNYGIMKNLMSILLRLSEKFLIKISSREKYEFEDGLRLLAEYNNRSLDKQFHAEYDKLHRSMKYTITGGIYYSDKIRLTEKLHEFFAKRSLYQKETEAQYPLIIYYTCSIISLVKQNVISLDYLTYQINFIPEVNLTEILLKNFDLKKFLKDIEKLDTEYYDYISLQVKIIMLYTDSSNEENYFALKKIILETIMGYSNPDRWHLTQILIHYLLNGFIHGKKEYLVEMGNIRKFQIENIKFNTGGMGPLPSGVYRNIAEIYIILGDIDFAEDFINKLQYEVEESVRAVSYNYCMALLEEIKGNSEKVLEYAMKAEQTDYQMKYALKQLALTAFYNLGLIEQGLNAIDSLKHFIKDTAEFNDNIKKNYFERVRMTEKLFKIKANPEKYSIKDLEELKKGVDIFNEYRKEWFLAKIEELKTVI